MWRPFHQRPGVFARRRSMTHESQGHGYGGMSYFLDRPKTEQLHPLNITLNSLEIGHSSIQGYRPQMEDQFIAQTLPDLPDHVLVAVLDGHAGPGAAQFVSRRLPTVLSLTEQFKSYLKMELSTRGSEAAIDLLSAALVQAYVNIDSLYEQYENRDPSGSTAVCAIITPTHILCANVGDSRCVIGTSDGKVVSMSEDHKPSLAEEMARIERAGGFVIMDRVNGELAMSRALGDYQYKQNEGLGTSEQMVSCYPDISVYVRKDEDDVMVLACDGIWDVMSNVEAVSYIQEGLLADDDRKQQGETEDLSALEYAHALVQAALHEGSTDNITAVVVKLNKASTTTKPQSQQSPPPSLKKQQQQGLGKAKGQGLRTGVDSDKGSDKGSLSASGTKASNPPMGNNNKREILSTSTTNGSSSNSTNNSHPAAKKKRIDE